MAKDRLSDLVKARNNKNGHLQVEIQEEAEPLTGGANLRETFERADILRDWIETIEQNTEALKQYIKKVDDINTNQRDLNEKIQSIFQNNTSICHRVQAKLKEFEEEVNNIDNSTAEGRIKTIQLNTLKTRYQKAFKQNNGELENFRNIKKLELDAQLRAKGVRVTDEELTQLLEEGTDISVFTGNILAETAEAKRILQDLEDRHNQLLKIERMLEEIRDLFLQMAILIDNQAELIDRVEYQASMAQEFVGQGTNDLQQGAQNRKKFLKKKIILIVVVVILIVLIIALILK
ncbi:unnamed protein product [Ceutorhynchus assimilis]|uniref:t-SNARE coiled-coil homology domain-containing protein n=1 Tax=Ceutorhynchus assimilis TaxID=467358 RepID=A0A9N9MC46_9CUCU|nr:unnamed protein product [Ceutorhynchus assimilis]